MRLALMRRIWLAALLLVAAVAPALADRRVAIVVGVADYGGRGNLTDPARDAREIGSVLSTLGYEVHLLVDPTSDALEKAFDDLQDKGAPIDQFAFFFSGHGGSVGGQSVLALNDGGPKKLELGLLPLSEILKAAQALKPQSTLLMLDACRTDEGAHVQGGQAGLAPPPRATGTFFAYAAAPGDVAFDDPRKNTLSPFTLALADELLVPNQDIGVIMRKVRERVSKETGGRQLPWTEDSLVGPLILNQAPVAPQLFALYGRVLKGDASAERDLGLAYVNGEGVDKNVERGLALLQQAAAQNDVPALLSLGDFEAARDADALFPNSKARQWYRQAAAAGSAEGWNRLGDLDRKANGRDRPPSTAMLDDYRHAADGGNLDARARLLALNLQFSDDKTLDRPQTIAALRPIAAAGNLLAEETLGAAYSEAGTEQDFKEADFFLDAAIRDGSTAALLTRAKNAELGRGQPADAAAAYRLTLEAAQRGNARAMLFVGRMLQRGSGVASDKAAAVGWFRKATEAGETEAFADLGFCYEAGAGVDKDPAQAVALYRRGAELKDPVSTRSLAVMYENGLGVRENMDRAIEYYERASDLGDVRAKGSLAVLAGNGMLTSAPDYPRGVALLREAVAKSDDADYIYKLARILGQGRGVPVDAKESAKLYARAAALGSAQAEAELATDYLDGEGVPKDPAKALDLYTKAAAAGDAIAYTNLAVLARRRNGATPNPADAAEAGRWSRRGAEGGQSDAMAMFGRDLLFGMEGVTKNVGEAFDWLGKSLAAGNESAGRTLRAIVTDKALDQPQAVRDDALVLLVRAATQANNPLAIETLRAIWQGREGVDMMTGTRLALEKRLDGPQHGMVALLLGLGYADGRFNGRDPDGLKAKRYFEMAAKAGEPQAWQQLGDLESAGLVPGASAKGAFAYYAQGAAAGDDGAINDVGVAYRKGDGVAVDDAKAFAAFKRAAEHGFVPAMYDLGIAYQRGVGTPVLPEQAELWLGRAAAGGNETAELALVSLFLNTRPEDRDYTRALFYLFRLVEAKRPDAVTALEQICGNPQAPKWVRARAAAILAVAGTQMPDARSALQHMVGARILKRDGERYVLAD